MHMRPPSLQFTHSYVHKVKPHWCARPATIAYALVAGSDLQLRFGSVAPVSSSGTGLQSVCIFAVALLATSKVVPCWLQVAETATQFFISGDRPNVAGLVLAGSADFKNELNGSDMFDQRLGAVVLAVVDVSYGASFHCLPHTVVSEDFCPSQACSSGCDQATSNHIQILCLHSFIFILKHHCRIFLKRGLCLMTQDLGERNKCLVFISFSWATPCTVQSFNVISKSSCMALFCMSFLTRFVL